MSKHVHPEIVRVQQKADAAADEAAKHCRNMVMRAGVPAPVAAMIQSDCRFHRRLAGLRGSDAKRGVAVAVAPPVPRPVGNAGQSRSA